MCLILGGKLLTENFSLYGHNELQLREEGSARATTLFSCFQEVITLLIHP